MWSEEDKPKIKMCWQLNQPLTPFPNSFLFLLRTLEISHRNLRFSAFPFKNLPSGKELLADICTLSDLKETPKRVGILNIL